MNKLNKNIKAYFIDLDGTTLDSKKDFAHWPSDENIKAIKKTREEGKHIIISTGRSGQDVKAIAKAIGGDYVIQANGALITGKNNKIIYKTTLSIKQTQLLLAIFKKHSLAIKIDDQHIAYGATRLLSKKVATKMGWEVKTGYTYPMHKEYLKIVVFGLLSKAKIKSIIEEIKNKVEGLSVQTSSNGRSIEITNSEATKGLADLRISKLLKISKSETAHIGDTMNDSTALNNVGQLIVMRNGSNKLKVLSPYRGPNYKNAGLAEILNGEYKKVKIK